MSFIIHKIYIIYLRLFYLKEIFLWVLLKHYKFMEMQDKLKIKKNKFFFNGKHMYF